MYVYIFFKSYTEHSQLELYSRPYCQYGHPIRVSDMHKSVSLRNSVFKVISSAVNRRYVLKRGRITNSRSSIPNIGLYFQKNISIEAFH